MPADTHSLTLTSPAPPGADASRFPTSVHSQVYPHAEPCPTLPYPAMRTVHVLVLGIRQIQSTTPSCRSETQPEPRGHRAGLRPVQSPDDLSCGSPLTHCTGPTELIHGSFLDRWPIIPSPSASAHSAN